MKVNTIITLEDGQRYLLMSRTEKNEIPYYLAIAVTEDNDIIKDQICILEEDHIPEMEETYVEKVRNPELIRELVPILKKNV